MMKKGFTLIELLIVVAIIAILAAIAVPNFLEAQTRSKVSRSMSDMRAIDTAIQSYIVDWNNEPAVQFPGMAAGTFSNWWGFCSNSLTTPVAYMTSTPTMPFIDTYVLDFWKALGPNNTQNNQPYTVIRDTSISAQWTAGTAFNNNPKLAGYGVGEEWPALNAHAGYIIYSAGPDSIDGTVWGVATLYDPTNGSVAFGDVYRFCGGTPDSK